MTDASAQSIQLHGVSKHYGDVAAVDDVSLSVRSGEFFALLGPSGCGKTTLLRLVAGFVQPDDGRILLEGADHTHTAARERPTAMVFQSYALFPTMTVGENVGYGLRVQKLKRARIAERVEEALRRVDLRGYADRPVTQLSGGQQQRVALARAIAVQPRVLLFDEPLSNLDVALREQTRHELKLLQHDLGVTSLYVTHDQEEALALSDRLAVMRAGRLQQVGTPRDLYQRPQTAFVAQFLGGSNVVTDTRLIEALTGEAPPAGRALAVRPEQLAPAEAGGLAVTARSRQFLGTHDEWWLEADGHRLRAAWPPEHADAAPARVRAATYHWVTAEPGDLGTGE